MFYLFLLFFFFLPLPSLVVVALTSISHKEVSERSGEISSGKAPEDSESLYVSGFSIAGCFR